VFTLVKRVLSGYFASTFVKTGAIILHGPHQGAQKSTMTGMSLFTRTSSKFALESSMGFVSKSDFLHFPQLAFL
jgi:hypothetical protein